MSKSNEIIADLHNHSTASDGDYTPAELVSGCREAGLEAVALTDHDTIAGLDEAVAAGHKAGITVIPGVEVTLRFKRSSFVGSLHLLLYFNETLLKNKAFRNDLTGIVSQGRGLSLVKDRIEAINREFGPEGREPLLKSDLTMDEIISKGENISRRHFFLALSQEHHIQDKGLIDRLIGNSSPAYIPAGIEPGLLRPLFDRYPVIKVLAHPAAGSFPGESHYKDVLPSIHIIEELLPEFLDPGIIGIDGLEVYYPAHTAAHEKTLLEWTERYGLLVTGGSDCHDRHGRPFGLKGLGRDKFSELLKRIG